MDIDQCRTTRGMRFGSSVSAKPPGSASRRGGQAKGLATRAVVLILVLLAGGLLPAGAAFAQTVKYIHTDALGSVVAVTDQNRNVLERREYEPYGQQLTPVLADGPGYTGHVQDAATGLTYMQQRYYDAGIGRFLSVDPVTADGNTGTNFNRYWYGNNSPYRFWTPMAATLAMDLAHNAVASPLFAKSSEKRGRDYQLALMPMRKLIGRFSI
ncbi:RHS repeat-associated core domain-containing protein [Luteimonas endophytica]|uniref:RHS repeat-associated core domain-containing protein n=1 Tax=Luteimonas endophytica TaxID=3042023 RepID=UPI002F40A704